MSLLGKSFPGETTDRRAWVDSEAARPLGLRRSPRESEEKKEEEDNMSKHVVIIPGDDAAPEAMTPRRALKGPPYVHRSENRAVLRRFVDMGIRSAQQRRQAALPVRRAVDAAAAGRTR